MSPTVTQGATPRGFKAWLKPAPIIVTLIILILVCVGIFALVHKKPNKQTGNSNKIVTAEQVDQKTKVERQQMLKANNFNTYVYEQTGLIFHYTQEKNLAAADKLVTETENSVPTKQLNSQYYVAVSNLKKAENDIQGYKKYVLLAIAAFKAEGNGAQAGYYERQLSGL